jgi:hypothetical protein
MKTNLFWWKYRYILGIVCFVYHLATATYAGITSGILSLFFIFHFILLMYWTWYISEIS